MINTYSFRKYSILLVLFFTGAGISFSQEIIIELVDNLNEKPVKDANVIYSIYSGETKINGFGFSDGDGMVKISTSHNQGEIKLVIYQINYYQHEKVVDIEEVLGSTLRVKLERRAHQLGEIKVEAESFYHQTAEDTITYSVDSISTLSTPGIREVLERIEGMSVQDNRIFFKGRIITRVFLDGIDLTGDSYMTLVDAINSEIVSEIDVISNYHRNPLLKEFNEAETVLNLRTERSQSLNLSGNSAFGVSDKDILNISTDLLALGNRSRHLLRFTANTLSINLFNPYNRLGSFNHLNPYQENQSLLFQKRVDLAPIENQRYRIKEEIYGLSYSTGIQLNNNWSFRLSNFIQRSEFSHTYTVHTKQFLPDTIYRHFTSNQAKPESGFLKSGLELSRSGENSFLHINLRVLLPQLESNYSSVFSGHLNDELNDQISVSDALSLYPTINYTTRAGGSLLNFSHESRINQHFEFWKNANVRTGLVRGQVGQFSDKMSSNSISSISELSLKAVRGRTNLTIGMGHSIQKDEKRLRSNISESPEKIVIQTTSDYRVNNLYGFFNIADNRVHSSFDYSVQIKSGFSKINWQTHPDNPNQNTYIYFELDNSITKKFNRWSQLALNYSWNILPVSSSVIRPDSTLNPLYSLYRGYNGNGFENEHHLGLVYSNERIDRLHDFSIVAQMQFQPDMVSPDYFYYLAWNEVVFSHHRSLMRSIHFNWEQYFINTDFTLEARTGFFQSNLSRTVNHIETNTEVSIFNTSLIFLYQRGGISTEFRGRYRLSQIDSDLTNAKNNTSHWDVRLLTNYLTSNDKHRLTLESMVYYPGASDLQFITLDLNWRYYINSRFNIRLIAHNILNNNNFTFERLSQDFLLTQKFEVRPRFSGLVFNYRW